MNIRKLIEDAKDQAIREAREEERRAEFWRNLELQEHNQAIEDDMNGVGSGQS